MRNLTIEERKEILVLHSKGFNISQIAAELHIARCTVRKWVKRNGSVDARPRKTVPRILTEDRVNQMMEAFRRDPSTKTSTFALKYDCSTRTIIDALKRVGVDFKRPPIGPLTEAHKQERVAFARDYRDFDFSQAIFCGSQAFKSGDDAGQNGQDDYIRYDPQKVRLNTNSDIVIAKMWGWMSADGPGELVHVERNANGQSHLELLKDVMVPTVRTVYPREDFPSVVFFQDNNSIHRANVVQDWLIQQQDLKSVLWPSRSWDLNPLENLWSEMVKMQDFSNGINKEYLINHCKELWDSHRGSDLCSKLVQSMRSRCDAVIDAGGALVTRSVN